MGGRRRWWRWVVIAWAVTAAVGGGLTLWLRDAAEPPGPYVWENSPSETPAPMLRADVTDLSCPSAEPGPEEGMVAFCAYAKSR